METSMQTREIIAGSGERFVETRDGTRLYWTQWGTGHSNGGHRDARNGGRPILFLNSAGMPTEMWEYQLIACADQGYRCIGVDRRGHGRSDRPPNGYDFDTFADDLATVIATLDLHDLTVIAHSMGCGEIVRYLSRHGGARVARVALLAPTTPFLLKTADNPNGIPEETFAALRDSWRKDYPKWIADNTAPFFVPETSPAMMRWLASMLTQWPVRFAIACNETLTRTDLRDDLRRISVPTLVVHGDRDASAPIALTGIPTAALIPGSRLEVYEGAPHGLMYTHMDRLHADIERFIEDTQ
jgi:non-heme chloroperoxidase